MKFRPDESRRQDANAHRSVAPRRSVFTSVPRVLTFKKDLETAGIAFEDTQGRRPIFTRCATLSAHPWLRRGQRPSCSRKACGAAPCKNQRDIMSTRNTFPLLPRLQPCPFGALIWALKPGSRAVAGSRRVTPNNNLASVCSYRSWSRHGRSQSWFWEPGKMVGLVRFELTTSCTPCKRATRLRYSPNKEG